jgi:hypothetical protein
MAIKFATFFGYVDEKIEVKRIFPNVGIVDPRIDFYGMPGSVRFPKKQVTEVSLFIFDEDHTTMCFDEELGFGFREELNSLISDFTD